MSSHDSSHRLYERACSVMPAGVNSPVRAFRSVGGEPPFYASASGCHFTDADGNRYIDYVGSWGPLILGHAPEVVVEAVQQAATRGLTFGAPCAEEVELAELVVRTVPQLEMVRFVSSGTEAVMAAVRLARGATGRDRIVKFSGCYHGHADYLLVAGGSGLATFGTPSSAGVPEASVRDTLVVELDSTEAFAQLMEEHGDSVAAVLIEGIPANSGLLEQRPEMLKLIREQCTRHGALMIMDEVITGFRIGPAGAAAHYDVAPDLTTFGKVIGGGMPVGAYGGARELMEQVSPLGPIYQAGTLSGNPVAMAAGLATLETLLADDAVAYTRLDTLGARLADGLRQVFDRHGRDWQVARVGSILWLSLQPAPLPRRIEDVRSENAEIYAKLHRGLLEEGVYLAPSSYEVTFVSLAHDEAVIDQTIEAFARVVGNL